MTHYRVSFYVVLLTVSGFADVAAAVSVWRGRDSPGRNSLGVVLIAAAAWSFAYALELVNLSVGGRELWGGLRYRRYHGIAAGLAGIRAAVHEPTAASGAATPGGARSRTGNRAVVARQSGNT